MRRCTDTSVQRGGRLDRPSHECRNTHERPLQTLLRVATVQGPDQNQWITRKIDPSSGCRPMLHGRCVVFISHLKEFVMTERNVDVMDRTGKVLHTYPITIGASNPSPRDADYQRAALK